MRGSYVFQSSDRAVAFKVGLTGVNAPFGFANFAADQFRLCGATWRTAMSASRCRRSDKEFEASTSMRFVDRYVGSDVASKMVEIAQGKLTEQSPQNLSFAVQDAGVMTSGSNDVVLALNLLHLLPDLEKHAGRNLQSPAFRRFIDFKNGIVERWAMAVAAGDPVDAGHW